jgi:hypothetical protein
LEGGLKAVVSRNGRYPAIDGAYCPKCGHRRRVDIEHRHVDPTAELWHMVCRECLSTAIVVVYVSPSGKDVAILWSVHGGLSTANTPTSVVYYLDQAARADSVGARSAAVAMYRAAVEQLLYEQGYQTGMLNRKITELEAHQTNGGGPAWVHDLDPEFLRVLKDLGNGSIHPNGGDITRQAALDADLIVDVRATVEMLLELVYEEPKRKTQLKARLRASADVVS